MSTLPITIFADFTCPFSYVTEAALWRRAARGGVEVRPRAYELYPVPAPLPGPEAGWREPLEPLLRELALEARPPALRPRTHKAHEAAAFAAERGVGEAMRAAIYAAYWADGEDIGRIDVLLARIQPLGVDPEELKIALDIDRHRDEVLRDRALAERLRITGTPTLFLGTGSAARALVGAQSPAQLDAAVERLSGAGGPA